ncbi:MAG: YIP1 family protein [bacterium]|nr:YIP1 family protein [bacterium]
MTYCPVCGKILNIPGEGVFKCHTCRSGFSVWVVSDFNAWNRREKIGFTRAFIVSACRIVSEPSVFFSAVKKETSLWPAFLFCWSVFLSAALIRFTAYDLAEFGYSVLFPPSGGRLPEFLFKISSALVFPLKMVLITVLKAFILHLCALIFGARNTMGATFRVVLYSSVSYFALLFPFIGPPVGLCWEIWLYMKGLRITHSMTPTRSAWAVMLPLLASVLLGIIGMTVFFLFAG